MIGVLRWLRNWLSPPALAADDSVAKAAVFRLDQQIRAHSAGATWTFSH